MEDHYFFRPSPGAKQVGPLSKEIFESLQARGVIKDGAVAWRTCGGTGYKIIISRECRCDREHLCSCAAIALMWEAFTLATLLALVVLFLLRLDFDKMLAKSSPAMRLAVRGGAIASVVVLVLAFFITLRRHRRQSTQLRTTEV